MDKLSAALKDVGIPLWGVCAYKDLLPLLPCWAASRVPMDSKSVIVCLFPYYTGEFPGRNISRYAVPDDYHTVAGGILQTAVNMLKNLYPAGRFESFVDNSPIREVEAARLAGLGVVGWNGQLIHKEYGSYLFIGTMVTTLALDPDTPLQGTCRRCGRCLDICPTGALQNGRPMDYARCRSHITQKKGVLTDWEQQQVQAGGFVWGCDLCTDACPMNRRAAKTPISAFYQNPVPVFSPDLIGKPIQGKAYLWRGSQVLLRNYQLLQNQE